LRYRGHVHTLFIPLDHHIKLARHVVDSTRHRGNQARTVSRRDAISIKATLQFGHS
jgi:hypothetical protein